VFRLGDGAQAAIKEGVLFLGIGGGPQASEEPAPPRKGRRKAPERKPLTAADLTVLARVLAPDTGTLTLSQQFKRIGVAGFDQSGQQNIWVDIAGIVRSIERAGAEQGGVARQGSRLFAERAADLRDALFEARPSAEGVDADLWLRFLPRRNASK